MSVDIELSPLLAELDTNENPWVLLLDGFSGAGKTVLATRIARDTGARIVSLDEVYPGWDGLAEGAASVPQIIREGSWISWDWTHNCPGEVKTIPRDGCLIVEGCGSINRASKPLATHAWWLERGFSERKKRALARDGELYLPHWDRWAAQEQAFAAREQPRALADLIISDPGF